MTLISEIKSKFEQHHTRFTKLKHERELKNKELEVVTNTLNRQIKQASDVAKALEIIQYVAQLTQQNLEHRLSKIVTLGLSSIPFENNYGFRLEFIQKRNQIEGERWLTKNIDGEIKLVDVLTEAGGGVADVVEFTLGLAVWSISNARAIKLTDEPFKFVSVDLQSYVSQMIKELSRILNMQIIMVSHLPKIIDSADLVIDIEAQKEIQPTSKPKLLKRRK